MNKARAKHSFFEKVFHHLIGLIDESEPDNSCLEMFLLSHFLSVVNATQYTHSSVTLLSLILSLSLFQSVSLSLIISISLSLNSLILFSLTLSLTVIFFPFSHSFFQSLSLPFSFSFFSLSLLFHLYRVYNVGCI